MAGVATVAVQDRKLEVIVSQSSISFTIKKSHYTVTALIMCAVMLFSFVAPAYADDYGLKRGRETGLPLPRFVSLKAGTVNLRVGPGRKYAINWQYKRRGLPVEVIQEFDQWRRIRDSEGATGWVLHSLLSSKRTAIVSPWEKPVIAFGNSKRAPLIDGKRRASRDSSTVARLQAGLMVEVGECDRKWCELTAHNTRFWLQQEALWGVYPGETVDG